MAFILPTILAMILTIVIYFEPSYDEEQEKYRFFVVVKTKDVIYTDFLQNHGKTEESYRILSPFGTNALAIFAKHLIIHFRHSPKMQS